MKLIVIHKNMRNFFTGHVWLIALSDSKNDSVRHEDIQAQQIEFNYNNACTTSLEYFENTDVDLEGENHIIFESKKPFKNFVKALENSSFKDGSQYDLNHTCVDSVLFALKEAGIDIDVAKEKNIKLKHLVCCFWCPTSIITPKELIPILKKHQAQNDKDYRTAQDCTSLSKKNA